MKIDPVFRVGKDSISPELIEGVREAIDARELIKIAVLQNCMDDPKEVAQTLAERTRSEVDRKSTRLNSSHLKLSRMPSSA